jgi:predicted nucleic acid-binding protein
VTLVDTSVWVEFLSGRVQPLRPSDFHQFVTCGPILQEVLQGLRAGSASEVFETKIRSLPCLGDPMPLGVFLDAAEIYREGRRKGHTIRSTTDCLIAAIAIENGIPIWHRDRDFDAIARYTPLRISEWPLPRIQ